MSLLKCYAVGVTLERFNDQLQLIELVHHIDHDAELIVNQVGETYYGWVVFDGKVSIQQVNQALKAGGYQLVDPQLYQNVFFDQRLQRVSLYQAFRYNGGWFLPTGLHELSITMAQQSTLKDPLKISTELKNVNGDGTNVEAMVVKQLNYKSLISRDLQFNPPVLVTAVAKQAFILQYDEMHGLLPEASVLLTVMDAFSLMIEASRTDDFEAVDQVDDSLMVLHQRFLFGGIAFGILFLLWFVITFI